MTMCGFDAVWIVFCLSIKADGIEMRIITTGSESDILNAIMLDQV
jgi:hypothetical protein